MTAAPAGPALPATAAPPAAPPTGTPAGPAAGSAAAGTPAPRAGSAGGGAPVQVIQIALDPRRVLAFLALALLLIWPLANPPADFLTTAILAGIYLVIASSLVLLIGLVGQISLCQATLVGIGAFVAAIGSGHAGLDFPMSIGVGMAAGAGAACLVGVVALRVRGLFFAVATLIFAYVADQYLFAQPWLVGSVSGTAIKPETIGKAGLAPFINLADLHDFYYIALAAGVFAVYAVANLRDSRLGRAFAALRGSEIAAASLGIDVVRTKLLAFAASGALAGLAGALLLVGDRAIAPSEFSFTQSLFFLAVAVVGGLRSLGGAVASSTLFAVLIGEVFYRVPAAANYLDLISASLLVGVLLFFRGGLGALPGKIREFWARQLARAAAAETGAPAPTAAAEPAVEVGAAVFTEPAGMDPAAITGLIIHPAADPNTAGAPGADVLDAGAEPGGPARGRLLLDASGITVRFGGLTAVDDAGLQVREGEIVGLIGPNGAGKTTLFNALLGLNDPAAGSVALFGRDVTGWPVHRRSALGVGRTFQVLQLFPDMTVTDNLLVATHLQNRTGLLSGLFATRAARVRERAARARVATALAAMQLEEFADRLAGGLPFGVLRLVEIARTLVTGAPLVCLDEPASGLDSTETERLIEWLHALRDAGVSLLVIEHDVEMVTRLCDRIYVLDQGKLIAVGTPAEIRADPAVRASYLGDDDDEAVA